MTQLKVLSVSDLSSVQLKRFQEVIKLAGSEEHLKGEFDADGNSKARKVIITDTEDVAGFFTPSQTSVKGVKYWRAGALYLLPKYRGKGLMYLALKEYFRSHIPGIAWIADSNTASINVFTKLGFKPYKPKEYEGIPGFWYTLTSVKNYTQESLMPSSSKKQEKLMAAAAHNPEFAKEVGVDQKVAKEFNKADQAKKKHTATNEARLNFMRSWSTVSTNEGLFDFLSKFKKHKPLTDEDYDTIVKGDLSSNVKAYLDKTVLDQKWVDKNLNEEGFHPSKFSFVDGVNQPDLSKVVDHLEAMYKCAQDVTAKLKANTALRQKLCKQILSFSESDLADKSQELYETHQKQLHVNLISIWSKAGGKNIKGLVASSNNAKWPAADSFVWLDLQSAPKDCKFAKPVKSDVKSYVSTIDKLVSIIEASSKSIQENTIPYWDTVNFDEEPSSIDEIQQEIFSGQNGTAVDPLLGVRYLAGELLKEALKAI